MPAKRPLPINPEAASGMLLVGCALVAIVFVNSGLADVYNALLHYHLAVGFGAFTLDKQVHHWINDVITSYSIHYTKLYDSAGRGWVRRSCLPK